MFAVGLMWLRGLEECLIGVNRNLGRSPYPCELFSKKKASAAVQGQSVYALDEATLL